MLKKASKLMVKNEGGVEYRRQTEGRRYSNVILFLHFPCESAKQQILFQEFLIRVLYRLRDLCFLESFRHFYFLSMFVFSYYILWYILFLWAKWQFFLAERTKNSLRFLKGKRSFSKSAHRLNLANRFVLVEERLIVV